MWDEQKVYSPLGARYQKNLEICPGILNVSCFFMTKNYLKKEILKKTICDQEIKTVSEHIYIYIYNLYLWILFIFQHTWMEMRKDNKNIRNTLFTEVSFLYDQCKNKGKSDCSIVRKYLFTTILDCKNCFYRTLLRQAFSTSEVKLYFSIKLGRTVKYYKNARKINKHSSNSPSRS